MKVDGSKIIFGLGVASAVATAFVAEGHARALLSLPTTQSQTAVLASIKNKDLNVRQTEALVAKLVGIKSQSPVKPVPDPDVTQLENRLEESLGTRVNVTRHRKGGTITIHYYSDEELNNLIDRLLDA